MTIDAIPGLFPAKFIQKRDIFEQWKKSEDNQVKNDTNECYQIHVFFVNENEIIEINEIRIIASDVDYLNHCVLGKAMSYSVVSKRKRGAKNKKHCDICFDH